MAARKPATKPEPEHSEECASPRVEYYPQGGVRVTRCQECGAQRVDPA